MVKSSLKNIGSTGLPELEQVLAEIADYVNDGEITSPSAYEIARYCLMDGLACAFRALSYPACTKLLGPAVPGATLPGGARVPGTSFELGPVQAAFNIGALIRWPGANGALPAPKGGPPSDNLGAILAVADYLSRSSVARGKTPLLVRDVLTSLIKACEIQGGIALGHRLDGAPAGVASTAVAAKLLQASRQQIINAVSNAWNDGCEAPGISSPHGCPAGDTAGRAVRFALLCLSEEMSPADGPGATARAHCRGSSRDYGSCVIENVLVEEARAPLEKKFVSSIVGQLTPQQCGALQRLFSDQDALEGTSVNEFMALMVN